MNKLTKQPAEQENFTGILPATIDQSVIALQKWPLQYYAALKPKTLEDALISKTPTLATFQKRTSEIHVMAVMTLLVNDLINFFAVSKTIGDTQLADTVKMLVEDFYYLNIEDFKLCFSNAKKGRYGKVYDRVDGSMIYEWVDTYARGRMSVAMELDDKRKEGSYGERHSTKVSEKEKEFKIYNLMKRSLRR